MKQIRLISLKLRDFQGGTFDLDAQGEDVFVFGANAAGKTRIASAVSWLLFGKDSLGRVDFEIKNLNATGEAEHGLEHTVEAALDVDGESITLKKVYAEKWIKQRGRTEAVFSGHSTQHYVDGVPKSEKEYKEIVADLAGDEAAFRLLTSPTVFPALPWQKQRGLLLDICGDITDADVIAADAKLADLPAVLGKRKLDDHKKIIASRRAEINKEIQGLPVRIDEVRRGLPDVQGLDRKAITAEVQRLETAVNDAKLRLQGTNTGGAIADLTKQLAGVDADIQKLESAHYSSVCATINGLTLQYNDISNTLSQGVRQAGEILRATESRESRLVSIQHDINILHEKWFAVDAETFHEPVADTCAACGHALPANRVPEARDKAFAAFNQNKAERLEDIEKRGHALRDEQSRLQIEVDGLKKEKEAFEAGFPEQREKLQVVGAELESLKKLAVDYTAIPARDFLLTQKAVFENAIKTEREGHAQDAGILRETIGVLTGELQGAKANADKFVRREQGELRIEELKAQEKTLAAEYERLEKELYLCEQFVRTKVSLLTERINSRFEIARFKLFDVQVNGGLAECCEITVNGVPYNAGLNNAARIQAGCDVIRTLQQHFGLQAPIIVDNRESVTDLPAMGCQIISLVVSPADKALRVEMARQAVAA
jgi:chromosome segregation ATPase